MGKFEDWLDAHGLRHCSEVFAAQNVDLDVIRSIGDGELRELGLTLGDRKRLARAIEKLKEREGGEAMLASMPSATHSNATSSDAFPSQGERRQLTVMFCDLVGSTSLAEKLDPEVLRELLHAYRTLCGDVVARYEGFVARYIGDGIMTYFGWPVAHEEDAERAVRTALEIVQTLQRASTIERLSVRVGIATGPVVVGEQAGTGDDSRLAVGTTPNLASRLQGLAEADQVVIAASTRRLVGGAFELADLGEHPLKGIAEPVHAWRVEASSVSESRFEARRGGASLTPLVGRELELGVLLERWALAREGEGQVVMLSGEAGIGKSRILRALWDRLQAQGAGAMRFQCSPYYANSAYWPSIDNFERVLKFGRDEGANSRLDKLESMVVGRYHRPLGDVRFLATMLSINCEERYGKVTMTAQKFKEETLRSLVDLVESAARTQTSAVLYEDLHWADPSSLEVLDLMIDRIKSIPLLIVLTHRPEFVSRWGAHGRVTALTLAKLTHTQSGQMVAQIACKPLPSELTEQILAKTDGVPLFIEELTQSILESGHLRDVGERYEYGIDGREITIPETLRDSLMARLDRFVHLKEVSQIGAAIGREFSYEVVSEVAPLDRLQLDVALSQLTDSGLAYRRGRPPEATYTFKHALVRDAAYDSLLKSRRQILHSKIAKVIEERFPNVKDTEPEVLARHLTAAGLIDAAIPLWQRAGELSLAHMALAEAISHLNNGLESIRKLPASPERDASELSLRVALGAAWLAHRGWAALEVWQSYYPALELAKSLNRNDALLPVLWGLQLNVLTQGRIAEALPWVQEMLDAAAASGDSILLVIAHVAACCCHFWLGDYTKSIEHGDRVLILYDRQKHGHLVDLLNHDPATMVGVYISMATWILGYPDKALRQSEKKDAHARQRAHAFDLGWTLFIGADMFEFRRESQRVRERAEECEQLGRDNGMPVLWAMWAPLRYGSAHILENNALEGTSMLQAGLATWDASGGKIWSPYAKSVLAEGMVMLGDIDGAMRLIEEQIAQVQRPGWEERSHYAEILRLKGDMLLLKRDFNGAEKLYLASLDCAREQQARSWELRTSTSLARLWQSQGKQIDGYDILAPIYSWFTEGFDTNDLKEAKLLLDELAMSGRPPTTGGPVCQE